MYGLNMIPTPSDGDSNPYHMNIWDILPMDIFKLVHLGLCEQTDMPENISFPQTTYMQAVIS